MLDGAEDGARSRAGAGPAAQRSSVARFRCTPSREARPPDTHSRDTAYMVSGRSARAPRVEAALPRRCWSHCHCMPNRSLGSSPSPIHCTPCTCPPSHRSSLHKGAPLLASCRARQSTSSPRNLSCPKRSPVCAQGQWRGRRQNVAKSPTTSPDVWPSERVSVARFQVDTAPPAALQ